MPLQSPSSQLEQRKDAQLVAVSLQPPLVLLDASGTPQVVRGLVIQGPMATCKFRWRSGPKVAFCLKQVAPLLLHPWQGAYAAKMSRRRALGYLQMVPPDATGNPRIPKQGVPKQVGAQQVRGGRCYSKVGEGIRRSTDWSRRQSSSWSWRQVLSACSCHVDVPGGRICRPTWVP
jgi:hypothetical protein